MANSKAKARGRPVADKGDTAARAPARIAGPPAWLRIVAFLLAIAGLGVSAYLTYTHFADKTLLGCSAMGSCEKVTTSPESMIFSKVPVALTGLIFYVYLVAIMSPWAWNSAWKWMPKLRLASMIAGIGMVLYLVYVELFQVGAICPYCTTVHIITFVLFVLVTVAAAIWGLAPSRPAQQP